MSECSECAATFLKILGQFLLAVWDFRICHIELTHHVLGISMAFATDYGHPERAFFLKIPNFWAWADKSG